jgi:diguanylate cyclase (GGDEF)-like protein
VLRACLIAFVVALACGTLMPGAANALEPIAVDTTSDRIVITDRGKHQRRSGGSVQIETAPGMDGISGRMTVNTSLTGANPDWVVFALRNTGERSLTFWLTAERYTLIGSGVTWPNLDARRIEALTPSVGFVPERVDNDRADIFQLTIDPGQTITYGVEMASDHPTEVTLYQPTTYRLKLRERQLLNGAMLGIVGVLGVFLTAVFAANHKLIFPSAALVAWSVLAYLCVDFGFWHKLFQLSAEDNAAYRAATESALAASLLIFLFAFLRLGSWGGFIRSLFSIWIIAQLALVPIAILDPKLAATFARLSVAAIGGVGLLLVAWLSIRGQDRALALMSGWLLFLVWVFGVAMALLGRLHGELVVTALVAGLVLVTVLFGFIVMQFAFVATEDVAAGDGEDLSTRGLAVDGAGAAVFEWHGRRDEVHVSPTVDAALGLDIGTLSSRLDGFCAHMHASDRERFLAALDSVRQNNGGTIKQDFRLRHTGNHYRWFQLEAAAVPSTDPRALRCCGLLRDITDEKRTQELLLHDAVHDSLTGLPNRELFLDRLDRELAHGVVTPERAPVVIIVDIDKFRSVNAAFGFVVGDSLLLTVARRLHTLIGPLETVARLGGNQFGLIVNRNDPRELAELAETIRKAVRSPSQVAGEEIVLTGAVGIAVADLEVDTARTLLNAAEIATLRAKRSGLDRFEIFTPDMRGPMEDKTRLHSDLVQAVEAGHLTVEFQPIVYLPTEDLAGFEALVRWQHPTLGALSPAEFIPIAEESDLIERIGGFVLQEATRQASHWQKLLPREDNPLFVSVNISSRQLLTTALAQHVRRVLSDMPLPPDGLRLELTESLVMENPEQANHMLEQLREAGARLAIDDFGTGYSSLAYLQRFPFDTIKIDRELVQASSDGEKGGAIVRSIVALAHELGKKIVAEGVETPEDYAFLRSLGCEYGQGFYYGEPMSAADVTDLLKVVRRAERRFKRRAFKQKRPTETKPQGQKQTATPTPEVAKKPKPDATREQTSPRPATAPAATPTPMPPPQSAAARGPAPTRPATRAENARPEATPVKDDVAADRRRKAGAATASAARAGAARTAPNSDPGRSAPPVQPPSGPPPLQAQPSANGSRQPHAAAGPQAQVPSQAGPSRDPSANEPQGQNASASRPAAPAPRGAQPPHVPPAVRSETSLDDQDLIAALGSATQNPPQTGHKEHAPRDGNQTATPKQLNGAQPASSTAAPEPHDQSDGTAPPTVPTQPAATPGGSSDAVTVQQLKTLPPGIARSLAKLAGVDLDGADTETDDDDPEPTGAPQDRGPSGNGPTSTPGGAAASPPPVPQDPGRDLLNRFRAGGDKT